MFINHNPNFVFVDIPKTGSRSVHSYLETHYTGRVGPSHEVTVPSQYRNYYKFTVVRNPYDRVCSYWWAMTMRGGDRYKYNAELAEMGLDNTLLNFLYVVDKRHKLCNIKTVHYAHTMHVVPQWRYIETTKFDKIIKLEEIDMDFKTLPFVEDAVVLNHLNTTAVDTGRKPIRPPRDELIDVVAGAKINEMYGKEFGMLGYKMEEF